MKTTRVMMAALIAAALFGSGSAVSTQQPSSNPTVVKPVLLPKAELLPLATLRLRGDADSNSPAVWEAVNGRLLFHVLTSVAGAPSVNSGTTMNRLTRLVGVTFDPPIRGGAWMEAVVADIDGTWYGYFHNEVPDEVCVETGKVLPRIGAARSRDFGVTWENLGTILEAAPGSFNCETANRYFVGGVGDFSVMLDHGQQDLYLFFSQYGSDDAHAQGVAVARMAWADRDDPVGKFSVWQDDVWLPPTSVEVDAGNEEEGRAPVYRLEYPTATPIFPASLSWHGVDAVDALWGPAVHWNTHLGQYVMLLNRAINSDWTQEGVYIAYAPRLDEPRIWSDPQKLLDGGSWYPQVIGLEFGSGTDKLAGERARFFMSGRSDYMIQFTKPPAP
jgi:hypothetical protein